MPEQTYNPLGSWCAPNATDPSYAICHDFRQFVAYGLVQCWLSRDPADPNADCYFPRPWGRDDVAKLRGYFLNLMQTVARALWRGDYQPGDRWIEGEPQTVCVGTDDQDEVHLTWYVCLQDDAVMLSLNCDGADDVDVWLSYEAFVNRKVVVETLTKAHELCGGETWDSLLEASTAEAIALWTLRREEESRLLMDEVFSGTDDLLPLWGGDA